MCARYADRADVQRSVEAVGHAVAVEALAETYRCGVDVVIVQPGAYPTELGSSDPNRADQERAQGYGPMAGALDRLRRGPEKQYDVSEYF